MFLLTILISLLLRPGNSFLLPGPAHYHKFDLKPLNYKLIMRGGITKRPISFRRGKVARVAEIRRDLERSCAILQFSVYYFKPAIRNFIQENLDRTLPAESRADKKYRIRMVKNSLMSIAIKGTQFEVLEPKLQKANLFFLIFDEEVIPGLMKAINGFRSTSKDMLRSLEPITACFGGNLSTPFQLRSLSALPVKKDLITRLSGDLNVQTLRLINSISNTPQLLLNTIKTALEKKPDPGDAENGA